MSALPLKADMLTICINVCFVPIADMPKVRYWAPAGAACTFMTGGGFHLPVRASAFGA